MANSDSRDRSDNPIFDDTDRPIQAGTKFVTTLVAGNPVLTVPAVGVAYAKERLAGRDHDTSLRNAGTEVASRVHQTARIVGNAARVIDRALGTKPVGDISKPSGRGSPNHDD